VLIDFALRLTGADTVALFAGVAEPARARREGVTEDLPVSAALLEHVRTHREHVLSTHVRNDPRFLPPVASLITVHHAVLAVPVLARGRLQGVLYCDSRQRADVFGELDVTLLSGLASHAALLIS
jgi:adenylate cyclase